MRTPFILCNGAHVGCRAANLVHSSRRMASAPIDRTAGLSIARR